MLNQQALGAFHTPAQPPVSAVDCLYITPLERKISSGHHFNPIPGRSSKTNTYTTFLLTFASHPYRCEGRYISIQIDLSIGTTFKEPQRTTGHENILHIY